MTMEISKRKEKYKTKVLQRVLVLIISSPFNMNSYKYMRQGKNKEKRRYKLGFKFICVL